MSNQVLTAIAGSLVILFGFWRARLLDRRQVALDTREAAMIDKEHRLAVDVAALDGLRAAAHDGLGPPAAAYEAGYQAGRVAGRLDLDTRMFADDVSVGRPGAVR